jgi:SAM-dependent methyltransferase
VASNRYPGIEFRQGDAQRLTFADASMDAIVGNFAILHVGRPEQAAAEFARVLVPNGRLALSTWDVPARTRLIGVFVEAVAEAGAPPPASVPNGPPFFRFSDDAEFARLLRDAGLREVEVHTVAFTHRFPSARWLWEMIIGATVRTRALVLAQSDATQARIRAAYDRIVSQYATDDGMLDVPISVKIATGVRPER